MKFQVSTKTAQVLSNPTAAPRSKKSVRERSSESASIFAKALVMLLLLSLPASTIRASDGGDNAAHRTTRGTDYRLGSLDKLRIKVSAWRPARAEVFSWKALDGIYSIGAAGTVSLPLLGEVSAAGATTVELSSEIGDRLKERIGLVETPDVSIEVVQFRPFYVVGNVEHPGEYPYRPGMNVLQALAIAGGDVRIAGQRLEREVIATTGELNQLEVERIALLSRKARLEAEFQGLDDIRFPSRLMEARDTTFTSMAMAQEKLIFTAHQQAFKTQIQALEQLHNYLEKEVTSLEGQIENHDTEVNLVNQELDTVRGLVSKGLTTQPRRLGLERNLAQAKGDKLRLESALMRVKQDISKNEIDILQLRNKRIDDATVELASVGNRLEDIGRKSETAEKLIYESEAMAPKFLADRHRAQPNYTIVRRNGATVSELTASETTAVEPGDTVRVELSLPDDPSATTASQAPAPSTNFQQTSRFPQDGHPIGF
jgi:protein involved in polysaccharide export with SLBB domain